VVLNFRVPRQGETEGGREGGRENDLFPFFPSFMSPGLVHLPSRVTIFPPKYPSRPPSLPPYHLFLMFSKEEGEETA